MLKPFVTRVNKNEAEARTIDNPQPQFAVSYLTVTRDGVSTTLYEGNLGFIPLGSAGMFHAVRLGDKSVIENLEPGDIVGFHYQ